MPSVFTKVALPRLPLPSTETVTAMPVLCLMDRTGQGNQWRVRVQVYRILRPPPYPLPEGEGRSAISVICPGGGIDDSLRNCPDGHFDPCCRMRCTDAAAESRGERAARATRGRLEVLDDPASGNGDCLRLSGAEHALDGLFAGRDRRTHRLSEKQSGPTESHQPE